MMYPAVPRARSISRVGGGFPPGACRRLPPCLREIPVNSPPCSCSVQTCRERSGCGHVLHPGREGDSSAPSDSRRLSRTALVAGNSSRRKSPGAGPACVYVCAGKVCWWGTVREQRRKSEVLASGKARGSNGCICVLVWPGAGWFGTRENSIYRFSRRCAASCSCLHASLCVFQGVPGQLPSVVLVFLAPCSDKVTIDLRVR